LISFAREHSNASLKYRTASQKRVKKRGQEG
jgi:hypothetical protein